MRRTFIPQDNDLGVWVCRVGLFPTFYFMRALSEEHRVNVDVKFGHIGDDRRQYFLKDQALPLNRWDCGEIPDNSNHWQLFAIGDEAGSTFMEECDLNNFQFPVQMTGIILIAERKGIEIQRRVFNFEFGWVTNQGLPFVIAAVGYAEIGFSPESFRECFGLDGSIPVVPGPALRWGEEPEINPEFARRVLEALYGRIKTWS